MTDEKVIEIFAELDQAKTDFIHTMIEIAKDHDLPADEVIRMGADWLGADVAVEFYKTGGKAV